MKRRSVAIAFSTCYTMTSPNIPHIPRIPDIPSLHPLDLRILCIPDIPDIPTASPSSPAGDIRPAPPPNGGPVQERGGTHNSLHRPLVS